jgi:hypothetical protein
MARATPPPPLPEPGASPAALRAQFLATEHWSLLASRTTTQNEVLTRISMFLTFVSAVLVSLALVGQATAFGPSFPVFAVTILAVALMVGILTQLRVLNVGNEDLMYVLAMNRLRAAYAELAPGVEHWFMASTHDDRPGTEQTYYFLRPGRGSSVILGSSMMFIIVVNAALGGLLAATIVVLAGGGFMTALVIGVVVAIVYTAAALGVGYAGYRRVWRDYTPVSPTP